MRRGAQLITYVDRLGGGGLAEIRRLLTGPLAGTFTGVHLLPFFTPYDGADAGFDPADHTAVDPRLGGWNDVAAIAATHDVMADLIVNHVSDQSPQYLDFVQHGPTSPYAGMFLESDTVFPAGPDQAQLDLIYRPRPGLPFTEKVMADGTTRRLWTTFTPHQIDLDMRHPAARAYLTEILERFAAAGVGSVRLDAVGYAIKTPGTSCFMTPETIDFIGEITRQVNDLEMESLLEIHSHYSDQLAASKLADWVYDFALPPLVLHALYSGTAEPLHRWLEMSPRNAITVLDTHDGIGVIDAGPDETRPGLLSPRQIDELVDGIHAASGGESRRATGAAASNLDLYQVNCTFYAALGCDDERYLLARLVQLLCPGVPQIYYAGLLAARNDMRLLENTGVGRDINRPHYSREQIDTALRTDVVQRIVAMARFRNSCPAFAGSFVLEERSAQQLAVRWEGATTSLTAVVDFARVSFEITLADGADSRAITHWDEF